MSRRGQIIVECDQPKCHAEIIFDADELAGTVTAHLAINEWTRRDGKDICAQCAEERR